MLGHRDSGDLILELVFV